MISDSITRCRLGKVKFYTREQEIELFNRMRAGCRVAREELMLSVTPLMVYLIDKFCNDFKRRDDILQDAFVNLAKAIDSDYHPSRGRLSTFVIFPVKTACSHSLYHEKRLHKRTYRSHHHGEEYREIERLPLHDLEDEGRYIGDQNVLNPSFIVEQTEISRKFRKALWLAAKNLVNRDRKIVRSLLRGESLTSIGQRHGFSRQRAYQLVKLIRNRLRRDMHLAGYRF